ncbi:MAG TPA: DUF2497 domain-containing protein [Sphingomonas sp.]|nr:DUF2497 domain-containing protein [Sphingomonas sp.]
MEDILASIKRIIAEDGDVAAAKPRKRMALQREPETEEAEAEPETASAAEPAPEPAAAQADEEEDVLELTSPVPAASAPANGHASAGGMLLSDPAAQASRSAFAALSQLQVRAQNSDPNTLEGLVADLLRPMLREWLDRELPALVERLVKAEIARISRG